MIRGRGKRSTDAAGEASQSDDYASILSELATTPPEVIDRSLPNLVETLRTASEQESTERFRVGVSFSQRFTPLDYELDRIVELDDGARRRESLKEAVSRNHRYLRFTYPRDPEFDACAFRGALLTEMEREIDRSYGFTRSGQRADNGDHWWRTFLDRFRT